MKDAVIIVGLGFGDEGKGTVVDAYVRRANGNALVVRYNGGCQAAHNVVAGGKHHTFAQFGSGTLAGARTHLSRFMLVDPLAFQNEARALADTHGIPRPAMLVSVEEGCLVTTPFHRGVNRILEAARGDARHGSCGMGIGMTRQHALEYPEDALYVRDLRTGALETKLRQIRQWALQQVVNLPETDAKTWALLSPRMIDTCLAVYRHFHREVEVVGPTWLRSQFAGNGLVLFEGAQGVLLDEHYGFQPYTTWTNTTTDHALTLLAGIDTASTRRVGVTRTYLTRHGAGPFPSEDPTFSVLVADDHNTLGPWQGALRTGALDLVLLRYALAATGGVDALAVTHTDKLKLWPKTYYPIVTSYLGIPLAPDPAATYEAQARLTGQLQNVEVEFLNTHPKDRDHPVRFAQFVAACLAPAKPLPVDLVSTGPSAADKVWP